MRITSIGFLAVLLLHFAASAPVHADSTADRLKDCGPNNREEKEAEQAGLTYVKKMAARCGGVTYLKSNDEVREFKGPFRLCLHEPLFKATGNNAGVAANYEVYAAEEGRSNYKNQGWSVSGSPFLIGMKKTRGPWKGSGLEKVTCKEVQTLGVKVLKEEEGEIGEP